MIYLDHNATTPIAAQVIAEMHDALERYWANPSSTHGLGQASRRVLNDARTRAAKALGCHPDELIFTSGATEANHIALLGAVDTRRGEPVKKKLRLVLSAIEHQTSLALAERIRTAGHGVDLIPVDGESRLDIDAARKLIDVDVALVSVMGANNETGVCMPLQELAEIAHARGTLLHVDATQLAGKSSLRFVDSGADLWSISAHKFNGPKGIGALLVRKGLDWPGLLAGRQERGRRGGTENLAGIVGLAAAAEQMNNGLAANIAIMATLRQRFETGLLQIASAYRGVRLYGKAWPRLPNTTLVRFGDLSADRVLHALERAGIIAASGAACSARGNQPSHVLLAMGESPLHAFCGVRFSLGRNTTADEIDVALDAIRKHVLPLVREVCNEAAH